MDRKRNDRGEIMKVLSIKEPFATLIKAGKKKIETRSWKTSYRGKLYIHASSTKIPREWKEDKPLMELLGANSLNNGKWVFCRHKGRKTLEIPGGHREKGERIIDTAKRELYEETGAINYTIEPISVYSVINKDENEETFGFLYLAEVKEFEKELYNEIEEIVLLDDFPDNCTYPDIQPKLFEKIKNNISIKYKL